MDRLEGLRDAEKEQNAAEYGQGQNLALAGDVTKAFMSGHDTFSIFLADADGDGLQRWQRFMILITLVR